MIFLKDTDMKIKIIATGGTIDKIYFDKKNDYQVGDPHASEVLKVANVSFDYEVVSLLRKDSLDLTDDDRKLIFDTIANDNDFSRFVVTHGTDTMVATAKTLTKISDKVIVLTGSMQPARFMFSDAIYNIGSAMTAVQLLPSGVYIAMNGKIFTPDNVRKNLDINCFEEL